MTVFDATRIGDGESRAMAAPSPFLPEAVAICVFDAYGTLFDTRAVAEVARTRLGDAADRLADLWRQKQLEYTWLRSLMGRFEDFWHVTGESLDHAMAQLGIADALLRASLMQAYLTIPSFPKVASLLQTLKGAGKRCAILSNGSTTMLTAAVNHAGIDNLLDGVLSVDPVGVFKPHPTVYQLALDRLGVASPDAVCFVSGNGWDAAGASAFGFQAVWLNRRNQPQEALPFRPRAVIADLDGLPGLLKL